MEKAKEKIKVRDIPAKVLNLILAVVAATSLFMVAADTLFGALLKLIV